MEKQKKRSWMRILRGEGGNPVKERKISAVLMVIGVVFVLVATVVMIWEQQPTSFVKGIDPYNANEILYNKTKGRAIPIDIRMKEDYEFQGNLSLSGSFRCPLNTSNLTGWGEFMSKEFYKDQTYVIYCARGNDESQVAATKMGELGFKNVYYLIGGFLRWKLENYSWG